MLTINNTIRTWIVLLSMILLEANILLWKLDISTGLLLRLKFRSARVASRHPAFTGNCQTISHTPHSPTYPVDEGIEVWIQSIAWGLNESTFQIKKNVFYFTSKPLFVLDQILEFYIFKFLDVIKCLSIKQEIHFTE